MPPNDRLPVVLPEDAGAPPGWRVAACGWFTGSAAAGEIRPDWDLSTPGLREAWDASDYSKFHGWDRRPAGP